MKYDYAVSEDRKIRLIISTDAKNEADDQYAIAHALMTPKFMVKGIVATHFEKKLKDRSMLESHDEIVKILSLMGLEGATKALKGAEGALQDEMTPRVSEGAELIISEADRDDKKPLFVVCIGALTDLASALLMEPGISHRMTALWVGGGAYPKGHSEFNLHNDVAAANVVFKSQVPLWQIPVDVCSTMKVGLAELQHKVKPCGAIGRYLYENIVKVNNDECPWGESWIFWDSSAVGVLMDEHWCHHELRPAPSYAQDESYIHEQGNRDIRVYRYIDTRFIFEDFFSKLAINFA